MKIRIITLTIISVIISCQCKSQSIIGFWGVTSVKVGKKTMTPVGKWFNYQEDGTFESGNGWTKNSYGTWSFDDQRNTFSAENMNGLKDESGPFLVNFSGDTIMTWEREEEGMTVIVTLVPIEEMPVSPADQIPGLWSLSRIEKGNTDVTSTMDPRSKQFIHIRPDKRYRLRNPDESDTQGFWHMDGHRPTFTLINYDREIENQVFSVEFINDQLVMKQKNTDQVITYDRINQFPR